MLHRQLEVSMPKSLVCQRSRTEVITTDTLRDLPNDVVSLFSCDAIKVRGSIAMFVYGVIDDDIPC